MSIGRASSEGYRVVDRFALIRFDIVNYVDKARQRDRFAAFAMGRNFAFIGLQLRGSTLSNCLVFVVNFQLWPDK